MLKKNTEADSEGKNLKYIKVNNSNSVGLAVKLSMENIIDRVRSHRDDMIKQLLTGDNLDAFFADRYNKKLSKIKREFLVRDLKELVLSPLNLVHYATVIGRMKESNAVDFIAADHDYFIKEIESVFKKYEF